MGRRSAIRVLIENHLTASVSKANKLVPSSLNAFIPSAAVIILSGRFVPLAQPPKNSLLLGGYAMKDQPRVPVHKGLVTCGEVIERGDRFEAVLADGRSLGLFNKGDAAAQAVMDEWDRLWNQGPK